MLLSAAAAASIAVFDPWLGYLIATVILSLVSGVVVLFKVASVIANYSTSPLIAIGSSELAGTADECLPTYTVLCPLYDEAALVPQLLMALSELDYPRARLDVILLVEEQDLPTRHAVEAHGEWLRTLGGRCLVVSDATGPRTKPRACNAGLEIARGELLTIYDAEDWPERDQLRKAVVAFRRLSTQVACLQCKLNYHNYDTNLLTRLFTLEYTAWYDVFLPGLRALRGVIPLGGTSNHFRVPVLRQVAGWDAYNVTEDCDLGVRLARAGFTTELLDSTTWEEACADPRAWLKQRSKWTKGYLQTFVCHTRTPRQLLRGLGAYRMVSVLVTVGGSVMASAALLPALFLSAFALWYCWRDPLWRPDRITVGAALSLASFFPYIIAVHAIAAHQRRRWALIPYTLLLPLYWVLASVASIRGIIQFFTNPFQWEKTPHISAAESFGVKGGIESAPACEPTQASLVPASERSAARHVRARQTSSREEFAHAKAITALCVALALLILPSALLHPKPFETREFSQTIDRSWFGSQRVKVHARLTGSMDDDPRLRAFRRVTKAFVTADDAEWFEHDIGDITLSGRDIEFSIPLDAGWLPKDSAQAWGPQFTRHIRSFGFRQLVLDGSKPPGVEIVRYDLLGAREPDPVDIQIEKPFPEEAQTFAVIEAHFTTGREWRNPFDAEDVDWTAVFQTPSGSEVKVPAFYTRDYSRTKVEGADVLAPSGAFYWAARFNPMHPGTYRWHVEGKDRTGPLGSSAVRELEVSPSGRRGFVRLDQTSGRFAFDNGEPHYPIGINLAGPQDGREQLYDFKMPPNEGGSFIMESYLEAMSRAGITLARVWLSPWFGGLEWRADALGYHGAGQYNLQNAWRVDRLLNSADRLGVYLELLLFPHGPYMPEELEPWGKSLDTQWNENPYNAVNGGPVSEPGGFLKNEAARAGTKNYLRYVAARFGAYTSLQSWDLWNEVDTVTMNVPVIADWHRRMAPILRQHDLGQHPISTGFRLEGYPDVWTIPELDFVQREAYRHADTFGLIERLEARMGELLQYQKPVVISEFGGAWWGGSMDMLAQNIHDGLWGGWVLGLPSSPMAWWWNLIFEKDLGRYHAVFSRFVQGEDLRGRAWKRVSAPVDATARNLLARSYQSTDRAYIWLYDPAVTEKIEPLPPHIRHMIGMGPKPDREPDVLPLSPGYASLDMVLFPEVRDAVLEVRELTDGDYRAEVWDTWAIGAPRTVPFVVRAGTGHIALPPLTRDVALKIIRDR